MKRFTLVFTCLILTFLAFQSNFAQTRKTTKRTAETIAIGDANREQAAIEKVIAQYCQLAKLGKFSELKKLIVKISTTEYFNFDNNKSPSTKNKSVSDKEKREMPDLTAISDFNYQYVTENIPQTIFDSQRTFTKILKTSIYKKKVKTIIRLESKINNTHFFYMNFYLVKNKQNVWKVYRIEHIFNEQVEIDG